MRAQCCCCGCLPLPCGGTAFSTPSSSSGLHPWPAAQPMTSSEAARRGGGHRGQAHNQARGGGDRGWSAHGWMTLPHPRELSPNISASTGDLPPRNWQISAPPPPLRSCWGLWHQLTCNDNKRSGSLWITLIRSVLVTRSSASGVGAILKILQQVSAEIFFTVPH